MTQTTTERLPLTVRPERRALEAHYDNIRRLHLRTLFDEDATRGERLTAEGAGIYLDYSKNRVTVETIALLCRLAEASGLRERIDAMFSGAKINVTEHRAVLHVALRAPRGTSIVVDGKNVVPDVHAVLDAMADFSNRLSNGAWKGHTGRCIRHVVNIGIGGSDLGPVMAYEGLKYHSDRSMSFRFVECRRDRSRRGDPRPGPGGNPLHRVIEDVHDAGNDDQRRERASMVARRSWRRRRRRGEALRRRLDERAEGIGVWNRYREHVRIVQLLFEAGRSRPRRVLVHPVTTDQGVRRAVVPERRLRPTFELRDFKYCS